jgi:enoyl-[acyl-carrier protein] reductase I
MTGLMKGKRGLIMGLANDKSLAWGIAQKLHEQGAELAFSYQGEALEKRVRPLAESLGSDFLIECDVSDMDALDNAFDHAWPRAGRRSTSSSTPSAFPTRTSCAASMSTPARQLPDDDEHLGLQLVAVTKRAKAAMMPNGGSILTLTYYGAEKVVPHYNVMGVAKAALETSVKYLANDLGPDGIRVNAISAGPIKTLAASGIGDFRYILKWNELNSAAAPQRHDRGCRRRGLYLLSDLASGVTGETIMSMRGYHFVVGMKQEDAPDIAVQPVQPPEPVGEQLAVPSAPTVS